MAIEEKVGKSLSDLGVTDAAGVQALFSEVRVAMEAERRELTSRGAASEAERAKLAKALRDRWLARKNGLVSQIDEHWLKPAPKDLKPSVGRLFNELRQASAPMEIAELLAAIPLGAKAAVSVASSPSDSASIEEAPAKASKIPFSRAAEEACLDLTLPGYRRPPGSIHPITRVQREIEEIFLGLGYAIETGPEVESTYYNFDALNMPATHPARDDVDSLYVDSETVLRTHTSPVQIRSLRKHGAPLYILAPGKAYRRDNPDATHSPMFHQVEGLAVDTDITFADLKGTLDYFCRKFFGEKVKTSFHPTYFPFTEPSGEVSISCFVCGGTGILPAAADPDAGVSPADTGKMPMPRDGQPCRTCKTSGWIEVMGCGMVHPEVLRAGGVDPAKYSGWAFGLGIDRFAMVKYDIHDIQLFFQSDMRFLEQVG